MKCPPDIGKWEVRAQPTRKIQGSTGAAGLGALAQPISKMNPDQYFLKLFIKYAILGKISTACEKCNILGLGNSNMVSR